MTVYYFSGSGHSAAVAAALAKQLRCETRDILLESYRSEEVAAVVFPVYCQNIPGPVKTFLKALTTRYVVLIATYGKISFGNVLHEAQKLVCSTVIAGAYIPIGHTFLRGDCSFREDFLHAIVRRIHNPKAVKIPRTAKNPFADLFPGWRSRMGVKIVKTDRCRGCGACQQICHTGAMQEGVPNRRCIRCLRCVTNCPHHALEFKNRWVLKQYLIRYYKKDDYMLYL